MARAERNAVVIETTSRVARRKVLAIGMAFAIGAALIVLAARGITYSSRAIRVTIAKEFLFLIALGIVLTAFCMAGPVWTFRIADVLITRIFLIRITAFISRLALAR